MQTPRHRNSSFSNSARSTDPMQNKGIEYALRALPAIIREFPNIVYIVVGQTHPNLLRHEGEAYRLSLERLAKDLGVQKNVVFFNRFVELGGIDAVHRRGGYLSHAVSDRGANHVGHAGRSEERRVGKECRSRW